MSILRQALKTVFFATAATLCGCSPPVPADCLAVRDPVATDCVAIDGQNWRFVEGEPEPEYAEFCSATCIDFGGEMAIAGRDDLRAIPLLRKMRFIELLSIGHDKLTDLSGLELTELNRLSLSRSGATSSSTFTSLRGLGERAPSSVVVMDASGLTSLDALPARGLTAFQATNVGLTDVDFTGFNDLRLLNISGAESLTSVRLPSGPMQGVGFSRNGSLSRLDWAQGLALESASFVQNRSLSSCRIQEFIDSVIPEGRNPGFVTSNGPCP